MERLLACMDGGRPDVEQARVRGFGLVLALVIATEYVTKGLGSLSAMEPLDWVQVVLAVGLAVTVATKPSSRRLRSAFAGFAALQLWWVIQYFPLTGNHRYLELWLALLLAVLDDESVAERRLLVRALRWTVVVVLVASGLQKLVHGYWLRGQFLAWSLWRENFRLALAPLLPSDELARLAALGASPGEGPYLVRSSILVLVSNAVWLGEIALGLLLVPRVTRAWAWVSAVVLVALTELVARELMFGIEFAAALMLFARGAAVRRFVPVAAVVSAWLIAMRLGWVPEVLFY